MARCTSAAATAESTPPDSPQMAWPSPTCSRTCSTSASAMLAAVHVAPIPAKSCRNRLSTCWPCGVCMHLGVVLHAGQPTGTVLERRDRRAGADGHHLEARGRLGDRVAVAHPHRLRAGQTRMQVAASDFQLGAAVLAGARAGDGAAERLRHRLEAVADAEHRHAESNIAGSSCGRAVGVHAGRAAGQHDGLRILGLDLVDGRGVRDDLGEHPGLPDPAGDQLGVLRAEVDDEDGARGCC